MRLDTEGRKLVDVNKTFKEKLKPYKAGLTVSLVMIFVCLIRFFITDNVWWCGGLILSTISTYLFSKKMDKMIANHYVS